MGKLSALIGIAALAGMGYYIGKKLVEKKNAEDEANHTAEQDQTDGSEVFVEETHSTAKEKLQKAGLFAAGVIKTSAEKFKEGMDEVLNQDMIAKGEEAVEQTKKTASETKEKAAELAKTAKDKAAEIAKDTGDKIKEIGSQITSINKTPAEADAEDLADAIEKDVDDFVDTEIDTAKEANNGPKPVIREIADDIQEAAEDIEEETSRIVGEAAQEGKEAFDEYTSNSAMSSDVSEDDELDSIAATSETFDFSNSEDGDDLSSI